LLALMKNIHGCHESVARRIFDEPSVRLKKEFIINCPHKLVTLICAFSQPDGVVIMILSVAGFGKTSNFDGTFSWLDGKPPATCILFLKLFGIIFARAEVCPVDWRASRV